MKHIIPTILLLCACFGLIAGITGMAMAFSLKNQTLLYIPTVMLSVVSAIINITVLTPSVFFKGRTVRAAAAISGTGLAMVIVAFIVLFTL